MAKRGLPTGISMRHDSHYVEELARNYRTVGKILPITQIEPNPDQPRTEIGDLSELTSSIIQNGVLEPILVKPVPASSTWMIIAGERRWRAASLAGLTEVPCIELDLDEKSIAEVALIENLQRKDLTIWEEADGLAALSRNYGYKHEEIAKKISKSRSTVTELLSIAGLPANIRQKCREAEISAKSILLEIARQFDESEMFNFLAKIQDQKLNRQDVRNAARPATQSVKSIIKLPNKAKDSSARSEIKNNTYDYTSLDNKFNLKIFFETEDFNKKMILRALKEAFEDIKNKDIN